MDQFDGHEHFQRNHLLLGNFRDFAADQTQMGVDVLLVVLVDLREGEQGDKGCTTENNTPIISCIQQRFLQPRRHSPRITSVMPLNHDPK